MSKIFLVLFLLFSSSFASSKIYFLPKDAKIASEKIVLLIDNAKSSIDISMYNLSYNKLIDSLKRASKRGVIISLYLDKSKFKKSDKINNLVKNNGIKYKVLEKKNHLKLALFDKSIAVFGSANWTKESFGDNLEIIYMTDEHKDINQINEIFNSLEKNY
ncbi:nuclease NucT [Arcobacter nitrofigilis DSM 7299]|uniref:phospholipase D n=1 Tax=Arcobacter nitrofigilis (strain ATCC 33309 / DSM 7299 / CCUG 15893 / LMG 7604 / NCTC 12251 / CI) TaxID=572480 RepID=D5V1P5_ARCNC|nr:phospholipase D-like domain-containing protein [Arcobacter nitrofigilis]ADG93479.1 nuclease NucT [Arcobacter nitrofigilis DSM 7299]